MNAFKTEHGKTDHEFRQYIICVNWDRHGKDLQFEDLTYRVPLKLDYYKKFLF